MNKAIDFSNYHLKFIILPFVILLFTGCLTSTNKEFSKYITNFKSESKQYLEDDEIEVRSWYHYVLSKKHSGEYIYRTFHPEKKQVTSLSTFSSKKLNVRNGPYKTWYDSGNKEVEGNFVLNQPEGHWKYYYYKENLVSSEGEYKSGLRTGKWKSYDTEGRLKEETIYRQGIKEGDFIEYDTLGQIKNKGVYKSDTIFHQTNALEQFIASPDEYMPYMSACHEVEDRDQRKKCSNDFMLNYIYQNIKYPKIAREFGVEGNAVIRFKINKDGSITVVEILSGICESIEKECIRIINNMPEWKPAKKDGKEVEVYFNLPIRFNLE